MQVVNVEPKHKMYLNYLPGLAFIPKILVEPKHKMYLNLEDLKDIKIKISYSA